MSEKKEREEESEKKKARRRKQDDRQAGGPSNVRACVCGRGGFRAERQVDFFILPVLEVTLHSNRRGL